MGIHGAYLGIHVRVCMEPHGATLLKHSVIITGSSLGFHVRLCEGAAIPGVAANPGVCAV